MSEEENNLPPVQGSAVAVIKAEPLKESHVIKSPSLLRQQVIKVTKVMAYRPILCCTSCCMFILFIVIVTIATGFLAFSDESDYDWVIADTTEAENRDALTDAIDQVDQLSATGTRKQSYDRNLFFLYHTKNGEDLYTAERLQRLCEIESLVALDPKYVDFCRLNDGGNCTIPGTSIVGWFYEYETLDQWECTLLSESYVDSKKSIIYDSMDTAAGQEEYGLWLGSDAPEKGYTTRCNSIWSFGAPLAGYDTQKDKDQEQLEKYQKFVSSTTGGVSGIEKELFEYFDIDSNADNFFAYYPSPYMQKANSKEIEVMWSSSLMSNNETNRLLWADLLFAIFSIIFVLFWIRVHTQSTFIALMGLYMIFMSLPFSLTVYKGIYGIPFFSVLHALVLFIVLGVGADDVFVLVDSWRMTGHMFPGDIRYGKNRKLIHKRLLHCYTHTMATVFNTSFTTATAFIATGFSPLMPISTFGWYAATCIVMNYIFVITLMPPVVIIADTYFFSYLCWGSQEPENDEAQIVHQSEHGSVVDAAERRSVHSDDGAGNSGVVSASKPPASSYDAVETSDPESGGIEGMDTVSPPSAVKPDDDDDEGSVLFDHVDPDRETDFKPNALVEAYIKGMSWSVTVGGDGTEGKKGYVVPVVALSIAIGLLAYGIVGIVYGTELTPPTEQEAWYPLQHMFTLADNAITEDFLSADENAYANLYLTYGINGIDRSDYDVYKPAFNRGDAKFSKSWDLALPSCQQAFIRMCDDVEEFNCKASGCNPSNKLARFNTTECFMRDYRTWMDTNFNMDTYSMSSSDFYDYLAIFRETEYLQHTEFGSWQDYIGFIDDELKYGTAKLVLTMESNSEMVVKQDVLDVIERFVRKAKNYDECDTCDCSSLMFSSDFAFSWMRSEEGLVFGFYQGLIIAFPVSFCVLLFATGNLISSLYAVLAVFLIVFSVLGFSNYALGWNLGIAESIAGIIIIGFAVDYTVHLGHMFQEGEHFGLHDRRAKFEFASRKIAMTIVGGAITTVGAGVFMFACQLTFFFKMATLIVATIVMSYLYSLGFFMAVLYTVGPEGSQGDIKSMYLSVAAALATLTSPADVNASKVKDNNSTTGIEKDEEVEAIELVKREPSPTPSPKDGDVADAEGDANQDVAL